MKKILMVDDDPSVLAVLHTTLKKKYRTQVAVNGETALELASAAEKPDLILLDIMMPDLDGFEVCRRLKDDPETAKIPVIFLSGKDNPADRAKGLSLGAVDFIEKPIDTEMVAIWVESHLM